MKKFLNIFAALLLAVVSTSCLEHDLEELDLHSGCDVTNGNVYYRYISDEVHPGTGENKVKYIWQLPVHRIWKLTHIPSVM